MWHLQPVEESGFHGEGQERVQDRTAVLQSAHRSNPLVVVQGPLWTVVLSTGPFVCPAVPEQVLRSRPNGIVAVRAGKAGVAGYT